MKKHCIFAIIIASFLIVSCSANNLSREETKYLAMLTKKTEQESPRVASAKKQLLQLVGDDNFDAFIVKNGIFDCKLDDKQSECVLSFYLTQYYRLNTEIKIKEAIVEAQDQFNKLAYFKNAVENYCNQSADFMGMLYTKSASKLLTYYQQLFKLNDKQLASVISKVKKDGYSQFLISENPTVADEIKTDFIEKCLVKPKANIINYSVLFK